jgi:hypothetical protein
MPVPGRSSIDVRTRPGGKRKTTGYVYSRFLGIKIDEEFMEEIEDNDENGE